ncbi:hypothetical protein L2747_18775 [Shewanella marinintestina]|uniref:hypothetical protein n=1 Tax=Shewanella marinintestina TaxID=190305 RepID=UPI00200C11DF|nr:hypothetical protein [Shewanella marinintestina]MCL1148051.1 hypothetical protein [Shewanella marinintestina]
MKIILPVILLASFGADAGFDERVAASFAAKYHVCAKRLDNNSMPLRALKLRAESKRITRNKIGDGYLVHFDKEKKKAWKLSLNKCKKLADKL